MKENNIEDGANYNSVYKIEQAAGLVEEKMPFSIADCMFYMCILPLP